MDLLKPWGSQKKWWNLCEGQIKVNHLTAQGNHQILKVMTVHQSSRVHHLPTRQPQMMQQYLLHRLRQVFHLPLLHLGGGKAHHQAHLCWKQPFPKESPSTAKTYEQNQRRKRRRSVVIRRQSLLTPDFETSKSARILRIQPPEYLCAVLSETFVHQSGKNRKNR
jgi:hypothetical protein